MQVDSENLQTYEQEDNQYISDSEYESNEYETDLDQQPEGEYISDSVSVSSVCAEYSRDRYDDEVYDQFANQAEPRVTDDYIGNYIFSVDQNSCDIKPIRSPSCVHLSEEVNTILYDQKISDPHHDNHSDAFVFVSNAPTKLCCHEDEIVPVENLKGEEHILISASDSFRSAEDKEDNLPFPDLRGLSNLQLEHENQECAISHESLDPNYREDPKPEAESAAHVIGSPHLSELQGKTDCSRYL